MEIQIKIS
ncbi:hypothetical protein F383_36005 [Gossypium arboreum]|uniref:Uncharacterized protein n=1 Tax=Gossypium arboreum TaxID=29729 RepID=A0A0B0PTC2_GOSAR|nr:hypothetical protein F383_36005 [Gossypium arboreum]